MPIPRGRIPPKREIVEVRSITREDLPRLMKPRDASGSLPHRLRESHHQVARLLASGMEYKQIAALTGYSYNRVYQLAQSPAMAELVAHYRGKLDEVWEANIDAYANLAVGNMIAAERHIADRIAELDEDGELLSTREALAISRDAADRFGYGKKQTNLNLNADFAAMLEKAIARSGKQIEGAANPTPGVTATEGPPSRAIPGPGVTPPQTTRRAISSQPASTPAPASIQPLIRRRA